MKPETTLNLKCPSCGTLTAKTLTTIKQQRAFDCECGYHADLRPQPFQRESEQKIATQQAEKQAIPA